MTKIGRHIRNGFKRAGDTSGTSAVEFALLSPLFLMMLFGLIAYGIYFGASHSIQQISADAARTALAGLDTTERRALAMTFVTRNAGAYPFVDPAKIVIETKDNPADPNQFEVSVRYDASALPIWNLFAGIVMPGKTIARTSTLRIGGI